MGVPFFFGTAARSLTPPDMDKLALSAVVFTVEKQHSRERLLQQEGYVEPKTETGEKEGPSRLGLGLCFSLSLTSLSADNRQLWWRADHSLYSVDSLPK